MHSPLLIGGCRFSREICYNLLNDGRHCCFLHSKFVRTCFHVFELIPIVWTNVRFSGGWKTGAKNGHGVFAVAGGSTFEGDFVDGEIEGKGSKQWADGRRYEGEFSRGEACGEGRFTSPTGELYVGSWAQNKRHGRGQLVLPSGQGSYAGEFQRHRYRDPFLERQQIYMVTVSGEYATTRLRIVM